MMLHILRAYSNESELMFIDRGLENLEKDLTSLAQLKKLKTGQKVVYTPHSHHFKTCEDADIQRINETARQSFAQKSYSDTALNLADKVVRKIIYPSYLREESIKESTIVDVEQATEKLTTNIDALFEDITSKIISNKIDNVKLKNYLDVILKIKHLSEASEDRLIDALDLDSKNDQISLKINLLFEHLNKNIQDSLSLIGDELTSVSSNDAEKKQVDAEISRFSPDQHLRSRKKKKGDEVPIAETHQVKLLKTKESSVSPSLTSVLTETSRLKSDFQGPEPTDMQLSDRVLHKISPEDLRPGDILCTYESVSTQPTKFFAALAQSLTPTGRKKNLHKMLHYEIVLEKRSNGIVKIAHADGERKQIVSSLTEPYKYPAGCALVVMRPKNERLRDEIIEVASTTVDKGNSWRIKGMTDRESNTDKFVGMAVEMYKGWSKPEKAHLKKMARMAVDSYDRFYSQDKSKLKAMSCAQFATTVINSSLIRLNPEMKEILLSEDLSREEKTDQIYQLLCQADHQKTIAACGLFHNQVTSAMLTDHILTQTEDWEVPGYIGIINETDVTDQTKKISRPLLVSELQELPFDLPSTYSVFKSLGLLTFSDTQKVRELKLMIAFCYLYAKKHKLNQSVVANALFGKQSNAAVSRGDLLKNVQEEFHVFSQKIENFHKQPISDSVLQNEKEVKHSDISLGTFKKLGFQIIKLAGNNYPEEDKTFILSKLTVEKMKDTVTKTTNAMRFLNVGLSGLTSTMLILMGSSHLQASIPLIITGGLLHASYRFDLGISTSLVKWSNRLEKTHEEAQATHVIHLRSNVGYGNRPWIVYSGDDGKTWRIEGLAVKKNTNDEWSAALQISTNLKYKFFISRQDLDLQNPFGNARWQKTSDGENVTLSSEDLENLEIDTNFLRQLPSCEYPEWD